MVWGLRGLARTFILSETHSHWGGLNEGIITNIKSALAALLRVVGSGELRAATREPL